MCCLMLALLVDVADARSKRHRASSAGRHSGGAAFSASPLQTAVCIFLLLAAVCGSGVAWCIYLEYEPAAEQVRSRMFWVVTITTCFELALCATSTLHWWMLPLLLLTNGWGEYDAVLRFPVLHDFHEPFAVKQVFLLILKVLGCAFGFADLQASWMLCFITFTVDICTLPLLYCLALPVDMDEKQQRIDASSVENVDVALRIFRVLRSKDARRDFILGCRRRSHKATLELAKKSQVTSCLLTNVSQAYKRELRVRSV